jgi:hypothetical protein
VPGSHRPQLILGIEFGEQPAGPVRGQKSYVVPFKSGFSAANIWTNPRRRDRVRGSKKKIGGGLFPPNLAGRAAAEDWGRPILFLPGARAEPSPPGLDNNDNNNVSRSDTLLAATIVTPDGRRRRLKAAPVAS